MKRFLAEYVVPFISTYIILTLLPYLLEEWGEALERGRINARRDERITNERRIRTSEFGSGSDAVKLHSVPTPTVGSPESGA